MSRDAGDIGLTFAGIVFVLFILILVSIGITELPCFNIQVQCTCIDKQISWDREGDRKYQVVYRCDDGKLETHETDLQGYYNVIKGYSYYLDVNKFEHPTKK